MKPWGKEVEVSTVASSVERLCFLRKPARCPVGQVNDTSHGHARVSRHGAAATRRVASAYHQQELTRQSKVSPTLHQRR